MYSSVDNYDNSNNSRQFYEDCQKNLEDASFQQLMINPSR